MNTIKTMDTISTLLSQALRACRGSLSRFVVLIERRSAAPPACA